MKKFICLILTIIYLSGIVTVQSAVYTTSYSQPPHNPPSKSHPRVYFLADRIGEIKANIEAEENEIAKSALIKLKKIDTASTNYLPSLFGAVEANAFCYVIYGDEEAGSKAISAVEVLKAKKEVIAAMVGDDKTRNAGRLISVLAELYDWCYNLLSETQKEDIIALCEELGSFMEIGWPPVNQGAVTGHGSETQLLRDLLSFAIAVYDERPDIWQMVGGRFYQEYVPTREFTNSAHWNHQGIDYGMTREYATACAYALITGMGCPEPWNGDDMAKTSYHDIYARRPDGTYLQDGDSYTNTIALREGNDIGIYHYNRDNGFSLKASLGNNPYIKNEMFRNDFKEVNGKLIENFRDESPVLYLITSKPSLKLKTNENLPLSKYFASPIGAMIARTGWEDGKKSNSVVAMMKIGEYYFGNHQHLDFGSFQIYYKGLLAGEGGNYGTYGNEEHYMYTTKSIAHNTMLIYDPEEDKETDLRNARYNVNDGGQKASYREVLTIDEIKIPERKFGEVIAKEIDPENTSAPNYTYIKGDLTNAYTDKVADFKRSMMFLNLKDEKIPAAMIVFDKVKSSDETFKKTWVLNSPVSPTISGNVSVFENTLKKGDFQYGGKMQVETLLPSADNLLSESVGKTSDGHFGIVRGFKYNSQTSSWDVIKENAYTTTNLYETNERNTYRLELSPKKPSQEDYFLNVITVGDAGEEISVSAPLIDVENFYGTVVLDRVVFFGKSNNKNETFSAVVPDGNYKYTICDMAKGKYNISQGETSKEVYVSDDGGVLSFSGTGGKIEIKKIDNTYAIPQEEPQPTEKNDGYISFNNSFLKAKTRISSSGELTLVPIQEIVQVLGYTLKKENDYYNIYKGTQKVAYIVPGRNKVHTASGTKILKTPAEINADGELIMELEDLNDILSLKEIKQSYLPTTFIYDEGVYPDAIYATGYEKNNKLYVNAKLRNSYSSDVFLGVRQEDVMIECIQLTPYGDGCYSGSIDLTHIDGDYEVTLYSWCDGMFPMISSKNFEFCSSVGGIYTAADESLDIYSNRTDEGNNFTKTRDGSKITFTRNNFVSNELSTYTSFEGVKDKGILHYSANVIIHELFGPEEYLQFRVRYYPNNRVERIKLKGQGEAEHKMDCIVDIGGDKIYIYDNGNLVSEVESEIDSLSYFHNYIVNPLETSGNSNFTVFDASVISYPQSVGIENVKAMVGKFNIYKCK